MKTFLFLQLSLYIGFHWSQVGFVLVSDISSWLGYCFDISILLSLVSDANTVESELVLYLCLISPHGQGIVLISAYCLWYLTLILAWIHLILISAYCLWYLMLILAWIHLILISAYCLWYLMPIQMRLSWFCAHAWYHCLFTTIQSPLWFSKYCDCFSNFCRGFPFVFPSKFCHKNALCVAGCCCCNTIFCAAFSEPPDKHYHVKVHLVWKCVCA